jgi:hypothetical protein
MRRRCECFLSIPRFTVIMICSSVVPYNRLSVRPAVLPSAAHDSTNKRKLSDLAASSTSSASGVVAAEMLPVARAVIGESVAVLARPCMPSTRSADYHHYMCTMCRKKESQAHCVRCAADLYSRYSNVNYAVAMKATAVCVGCYEEHVSSGLSETSVLQALRFCNGPDYDRPCTSTYKKLIARSKVVRPHP